LKRALLFLAVVLWCASNLFPVTITLTNQDPQNNPNLINRDWRARLRNFGVSGAGNEIYIGSGDLSFAANRKVADMIWNNTASGVNTFTMTYAPAPARITMTAAGSTTGSQFYDFQTPVANPNQFFNALLIRLKTKKNEEIRITNLVLTIPGISTTNLGTIQIDQGTDIWGLVSDIQGAYTSGFSLTGNIFYPEGFQSVSEEQSLISVWAFFDRNQPAPDLTLTKSHAGNFIQGQAGATYTVTARNIGAGPTSGTVTVVDNFPPSLTPTAAAGSGWTCNISAKTATCTRSDTLASGGSYPPINFTANVAPSAPPAVVNAAALSGGNDGNSANNTVTDATTIIRSTDLTIAKTANGSFTQGQIGAGYTLTVTNAGGVASTGTVTVIDNLPTGLSPTMISGSGWSCSISGNTTTCTRSDALAPGAGYPPITLTVNVAANAPASVTNTATVGGGGDLNAANNAAMAATPIAHAPDLSITKSHTGNFAQGRTATYTVTVTNTGAAPTSATVVVSDPMPLPLTPRTASGSGWTCNVLTGLIRCQRSDALAAGASYPPITMTASITAEAAATLLNTATVSGGGDRNAANNSASDTATVLRAPDLTLTMSHAGNFTQGQSGSYTVTVSNVGGSSTTGSVTVSSILPAGLAPTAASGTGWTCTISSQGVSCSRSDTLAPGQSYPAIILMVSVQPNALASVTPQTSVSGGGGFNLLNNTATDPTTIAAGANLTITKSHTGNFTQGQTGSYTITVSNTGASPTNGAITVTDSLPSGLTSTAAAGTGWSCTPGGQSIPCTHSDSLAAGASYPPITLTVQAAVNAPASVTNTATVAGSGDVDLSNNSASDPTTIIAVPDLTIRKTRAGSFLQGQVGAQYVLTVSNIGGGPTGSPVTVSDTLPAGLTPTAAAGAGWLCNIAGQNVSCTRSDALNIGASYPAITLTVNVAPDAPPSLTNTAMVSGGGEINTANNTANNITTIGPGPDLTITKSHSGDFRQGQTGAIYTITVSNTGSAPTSGVVTATDNVPAGLTPASAAGAGWTCNISGQNATCTRSDPLAADQSYPGITLMVNVIPGAPGSLTNGVSVSGGGDVNPANNLDTDATAIIPGADLTITKSHTGNFIQGQTGATYTVTVTNSGVGPTTGIVTGIDTFPLGITPTAGVGAGWTCFGGAPPGCTRSDALAAGASYPPVTVTVNVAANAPAMITNVVEVSGGGDSNAANNTASDPTTILAGPDLTVTKSHTGNFTQGQSDASYTITAGNSGGSPTSGPVSVIDLVPAGLVPSAASGTGWHCDVTEEVTCVRSDPLGPGSNYPPITVTVDVASNAPASLTNIARVSGGGESNSANNEVNDVTAIIPGPDLTLTKTHVGNFTQGQVGATYTVTVSNQGAAPTSGAVIVNDAMPLPFQPTAAGGPGWTCEVQDELVRCQRSDALAAAAAYPPITITLNVAATAPPSVINTVEVSGGSDINAANNTAGDLTTIVPGPDLAVTKTHAFTFTQGQSGVEYTITVRNTGDSPTTGTVTLIDRVPAGLIPVAAGGAGWTCSISLQPLTCTRDDALAAGASYPSVTIRVDVESDAPASVTNTVDIAGGGDVNTSNNTATDPTQINRGQDLTVSKSHTASFIQGQTGLRYTITVTNRGSGPTIGTITLIDTVPTGLFPAAATGTGWACEVSGQTVHCTRGDPLARGASYEPVTVTVDVANDAPASLTNRGIIAGGGDVNSPNNIADDKTTIAPGPDLTIAKTHPDSFGPGKTGVTFILTVTNRGGSPTQGEVDVVDEMPEGLTARAAGGGGWNCEVSPETVACFRTDPLAPGANYPPITLTVDVASDLAIGSTVTNAAEVSKGGDVNPANNRAEDSEVLFQRPELRISKTHSGSFTQGQTGATYSITVSNAGQDASSGEVRVQDRLPTGLSPTSASGSGWTCMISGSTVACTRSDTLAPGGSYPPITLEVTVAPDALPTVTNTATVSGGGDDSNDSASDITTIQTGGPYTFAQVTVGGGYSTGLILSNTGTSGAAGDLILTDQNGSPFLVSLSGSTPSAQSSSSPPLDAVGSSFPYFVPPGGTRILQVAPLDPSEPVRTGWVLLVPSAGYLSGVASFQFVQNDHLLSTVSVFGGYPLNVATIPVDNDDTQNRFTGFTVANPANESVNIRLYLLDEAGAITDALSPPDLNPLGPLRQVARFLHEYLPSRLRFNGSLVLVAQGGKKFAVVALVQRQMQMTAVPVIPSKAPQVPD
jgi:uncharacterized repeat protein (TIGR01451 family)